MYRQHAVLHNVMEHAAIKKNTHTRAAFNHATVSQAIFCSGTLFQIPTAFAAVFCKEEEV